MEAMVVYRFHIALRDVSPKIWRRVELTAGNSLAYLQRVIQMCLGWSDEYQHRFCIRNHHLGAFRPGGLLFFGDPIAMTLSQFAVRLKESGPFQVLRRQTDWAETDWSRGCQRSKSPRSC